MTFTQFDRLQRGVCGLALALTGFASLGSALAQTCEWPLPLTDGQGAGGNTCLASNVLPYFAGGVFDGAQNDVVYKIHSDAPQSGSLTFNTGTFSGMTAILIPQCNPIAPVSAIHELPYDGSILTLPVLPAGDNYLVITGDPGVPYYGPPICGTYSFSANLPDSRPGGCGAPLAYASGTRRSGNTCASANFLPDLAAGALDSPQNDLVYRIDASRIVNRRLYIDAANFDLTVLVVSSCAGGASAIAEVPAGTSGVITIPNNLTSTQTLVITGDPGGPASGCGSFSMSDLEPSVITDSHAFGALLQPVFYSEGFTQAPAHATPLQMDFSKNGYAYRITPAGTAAQLQFVDDLHVIGRSLAVAASSASRSLRITFSGAPVNAFGGLFNVKSTSLFALPGVLTVTIRTGARTKTYTLRGSDDFRGFTSRTRIDEIFVSSSAPGRLVIDNLVVGFTDTPQ